MRTRLQPGVRTAGSNGGIWKSARQRTMRCVLVSRTTSLLLDTLRAMRGACRTSQLLMYAVGTVALNLSSAWS